MKLINGNKKFRMYLRAMKPSYTSSLPPFPTTLLTSSLISPSALSPPPHPDILQNKFHPSSWLTVYAML